MLIQNEVWFRTRALTVYETEGGDNPRSPVKEELAGQGH